MHDTSIADTLRAEGLRVIECDGWQTRGSDSFAPAGWVWHHTAGGANGSAPSLNGVIYGFANSAPGPLANLLQSREPDEDDIFYVVAAGTANHAGTGGWNGLSGNHSVYGIEIEHVGTEPLPEARGNLAIRAAAALLRALGHTDAAYACQHSEWSNYGDGSKIDVATNVDPDDWRDRCSDAIAGTAPIDWDGIIAATKGRDVVTIIRNVRTAEQFAYDGMSKRYLRDQDEINILGACGLLVPGIPVPVDLLDEQVAKIPDR